MKRTRIPVFIARLLALTMIIGFTGCYYDKEDLLYHKAGAVDCSLVSATYSADVAPLIKNKCATAGCHNAAGSAGGTVLENYAQVAGVSARIYQRCVVEQTMPPGGALSPAETAIITCWINSGTPNN